MMLHEVLFWTWIISGLLLGFLELSSPGFFFFIACSFGCFFAAMFAWYQYTIFVQVVVAVLVMFFSLLGLYMVLKKHAFSQEMWEKHATNIDALVGKEGLVIQKIVGKDHGAIKIRGEVWSAETDESVIFEKNDRVVVVKVVGNKVVVKKSI